MARILLIEPDRILGANAKKILQHSGYSVDWHVDPQAAMDNADAVHPDIIILDLFLAGRSGVEFLYELRSYPEWAKLPVIIYSSVPTDEFHTNHLAIDQLNIAAYYYKPTSSVAMLLGSIERILQPVRR